MSNRYLLHVPSGVVYIYDGVFARNPEFVECADAKGTPLPPAIDGECEVVEEAPKPKKTRAKKVEVTEEDADLDELLGIEAGRGL